MNNGKININIIRWLVVGIVPLSGLGIDIFVPSLPAITHYFYANPSETQLSVPIYLIGYACFQIFWGTLSDSLGRRPLIIAGIGGMMLTCTLITLSPTIIIFLLLRFLQGVCVAPALVLARTLFTDIMTGRTLEKYSHVVPLAWGMSPIIAPWIGGYLQHYFGWRGPFLFLAGYCLILLCLILRFLPETLTRRSAFSLKNVKVVYREIIVHPTFLGSVIIMAIVYGLLTIFNVVGPFLIQIILGYSSIAFGRVALLVGLAWFGGFFFLRWLRNYFSAMRIITIVFILLNIISLTFLLFSRFYLNLSVIILPLMALFFGAAIIYSNSFALCVSLFPKNAGTASAIMGTITMAGAGLLSTGGSLLKTNTVLPLAMCYLGLMLIASFLYIKVARVKPFSTGSSNVAEKISVISE